VRIEVQDLEDRVEGMSNKEYNTMKTLRNRSITERTRGGTWTRHEETTDDTEKKCLFSCNSILVFREQPLPENRLSSDDLDLMGLILPSSINHVYSRETRSSVFTDVCFKLLMLYRYEFFSKG
jgi:hypothetical protein